MKKCLWCDTDISDKRADAKFCSPAHKLSFNRKQGVNEVLADLPPVVQASKIPVPPKKEDAPFTPEPQKNISTSDWPGSEGWWAHGTVDEPSKTWDRVCVRCGEKYTTSLSLMRFCSDECKSEVMVVIANGPHPKYVEWAKR